MHIAGCVAVAAIQVPPRFKQLAFAFSSEAAEDVRTGLFFPIGLLNDGWSSSP